MTTLTISGAFVQTSFAQVTKELYEKLLSGDLDLFEFSFGEMENLPTWRSIYGVEDPDLLLDDEELDLDEPNGDESFLDKVALKTENSFKNVADDEYPVDVYPKSSVYLDKFPVDKYFFIIKEYYEGYEYRQFEGAFDKTKLTVARISLWADDELTDVYNIGYEGAEIVDETETESRQYWVYHNDVLSELG